MKQIILVMAMLAVWAFPMDAQDEGDSPRAVIAAQIDAFIAEDLDAAFGFASQGIRRLFVTPEGFGSMVQTGYPMVWRPTETRFLELREIDGEPWQKVALRDADGAWHVLDYKMVREAGQWRIDGVQFLRQAEVGV